MDDYGADTVIDCSGANGDAAGHTSSPENDFGRIDVRKGRSVVEGIAVVAALEEGIYFVSGCSGTGSPVSVVVEEHGVSCFLKSDGVVGEEVFFQGSELDWVLGLVDISGM